MQTKNWKPLFDFAEYTISEVGEIQTNDKVVNSRFKTRVRKAKTVTQFLGNAGYLRCHLYKDGKHYNVSIHRMVALSFIPNPENKPCVNHKDGNKLNNHVSNLEWCTRSENSLHSFRMGLQKPTKSMLGKFGNKHNRSKNYIIHENMDTTATEVTKKKFVRQLV